MVELFAGIGCETVLGAVGAGVVSAFKEVSQRWLRAT